MNEILNKYKDFLNARNLSQVYYNYSFLFLKWCDKNKIDYKTITQDIITKFFIDNSKYSSSTRNNFIKAGRSLYTQFLQIPQDKNAWFEISLMKTEHKRPDFLTQEEIVKGIKYLSTYNNDLLTPTKADGLFTFWLYTGLRKGELLNLKRQDFDLPNGSVIVRVPNKGKEERIVFYPKEVVEKLEKYFTSEKEEINAFNLSLGQLHYIVKIMGEHLNKHIYCHLMRHSSGRFLIGHLKDPFQVKEQLGHKDIKTTMIYTLPDEKMRKKAMGEAFDKKD